MIITATDISKRYSSHWILRKFNYKFESGNVYAIQGPNGSGKSTLLKILSGFLSPTVGKLEYWIDSRSISREDIFQYVTICGPYVSLIQELSVREMIAYFMKRKPLSGNPSTDQVLNLWNVKVNSSQLIKELSSGQAQKLGLLLAALSTSPILLLDEPTSFLDKGSKDWYFNLLEKNLANRIVIVASNDANDFRLSSVKIIIQDYQ